MSDIIELTHGLSKATVSPFGATILSYSDENGSYLFLSSKCIAKKAFRGGIPIVFPQFGPGLLPQHGFARISTWTVLDQSDNQVKFGLTRQNIPKDQAVLWPYQFELIYTVTLSDVLTCTLEVENTDNVEFSFTTLLHSYFSVTESTNVLLPCFNGSFTEHGKAGNGVPDFKVEVDRVYSNINKAELPSVTIESTFKDIVVWNPGKEKGEKLADLDHWNRFVCVEAGNVIDALILKSGATWTGKMVVRPKL